MTNLMPTDTDKRIIRGSLTGYYQDGYAHRMLGGPNMAPQQFADKQARWLYQNGVEDAAADAR